MYLYCPRWYAIKRRLDIAQDVIWGIVVVVVGPSLHVDIQQLA